MSALPQEADVVIVGAGPAGLAAAVTLRGAGAGRVVVLEREPAAGGIPRHCGHSPYGLREFRRLMRGPAYASRLAEAARASGAEILTGVDVVALEPGPALRVTSDAGPARMAARAVLLATGCRETPRAARLIGGTRPQGVMNTAALQGMVYLHGLRPFARPVILGSELVAFSALMTCRHGAIRPVAMVEPGARATARWPASLVPRLLGVPLHLATELVAIEGRGQVTGVVLARDGTDWRLPCDGVVVSGGFRPESALVAASHLALDPATQGPEVDEYGRCSDPGYYAAGNLLRGVETAGHCWSEGRAVAGAIAAGLAGRLPAPGARRLALEGEALRYAVPQRLSAPGPEAPAPALPRLQVRLSRAARGRLGLWSGATEAAGRSLSGLPERRLHLPLPRRDADARLRFTEEG